MQENKEAPVKEQDNIADEHGSTKFSVKENACGLSWVDRFRALPPPVIIGKDPTTHLK